MAAGPARKRARGAPALPPSETIRGGEAAAALEALEGIDPAAALIVLNGDGRALRLNPAAERLVRDDEAPVKRRYCRWCERDGRLTCRGA